MNAKSIGGLLGLGLLAAGVDGLALTVEVQRFSNAGPVPVGYQNVAGGVDPAETVQVSEAPFVDYLIPNNTGTAGVTARKTGGQYITSTTVDAFTGGANNLSNPDRYHVVYEWTDGTPLPFGFDFYGVSWNGWNASEVATLTTRIELAVAEEITVFHWFNDGWHYNADGSGHQILDGHVLAVTHYRADGTEVAAFSAELPSGGAELIFGDQRQFYSSIITAKRTAPGDFLIIQNNGGNVGYKGTAVALLGGGDSGLTVGEYNPTGIGLVFGATPAWGYSVFMGFVHMANFPWMYHAHFGWTCLAASGPGAGGGTHYWLYNPSLGWLSAADRDGGAFWILAEGRADDFRRPAN